MTVTITWPLVTSWLVSAGSTGYLVLKHWPRRWRADPQGREIKPSPETPAGNGKDSNDDNRFMTWKEHEALCPSRLIPINKEIEKNSDDFQRIYDKLDESKEALHVGIAEIKQTITQSLTNHEVRITVLEQVQEVGATKASGASGT